MTVVAGRIRSVCDKRGQRIFIASAPGFRADATKFNSYPTLDKSTCFALSGKAPETGKRANLWTWQLLAILLDCVATRPLEAATRMLGILTILVMYITNQNSCDQPACIINKEPVLIINKEPVDNISDF